MDPEESVGGYQVPVDPYSLTEDTDCCQ